jgi:uncharacterized membrane protein (UPF0127 family)
VNPKTRVPQNAAPTGKQEGWWLLRSGDVLASAEVATSIIQRSKGLLGKKGYEGALVLHHTRSVHSIGMRFPIDVAFLDRKLVVVDVTHVPPWRIALPRVRARSVLEAEAGAFERWSLKVGDELELRCGQ